MSQSNNNGGIQPNNAFMRSVHELSGISSCLLWKNITYLQTGRTDFIHTRVGMLQRYFELLKCNNWTKHLIYYQSLHLRSKSVIPVVTTAEAVFDSHVKSVDTKFSCNSCKVEEKLYLTCFYNIRHLLKLCVLVSDMMVRLLLLAGSSRVPLR